MADVDLTLTPASAAGVAANPTAMDAADTYKARNNGRVLLHFVKTGAGEATITVTTPQTVAGLAVADRTFAVPATTGNVWAGPFPTATYNDAAGDINITTSEDTSITIEAIQV